MSASVLIDLRPSQGSPTGAGVYLRDLANALHQVLPVEGLISPARGAVPEAAVPLTALSVAGPAFNLAALRLAARQRCSLISASRLPAVLRPARGIPVFLDLVVELFPETQTVASVAVKRLLDRRAARAQTVLSMSMTTTTDLVRYLGAPPNRIVTVRPGCVPPQPDNGTDGAVLERLGIRQPYVLALGTLEPRKNLVLLLDVFRQAAFSSPVQLVLAGARGWKMGPVEAQSAELEQAGVLKRPGYVATSERAALYRQALCLAFPSLYEGFGLPLLEAMSYGTPVVASTAPACVEVVGDAGILLPPRDIDGWTRAIRGLLDDAAERSRLRAAGLARAQLFRWSDSVRPLVDRLAA